DRQPQPDSLVVCPPVPPVDSSPVPASVVVPSRSGSSPVVVSSPVSVEGGGAGGGSRSMPITTSSDQASLPAQSVATDCSDHTPEGSRTFPSQGGPSCTESSTIVPPAASSTFETPLTASDASAVTVRR